MKWANFLHIYQPPRWPHSVITKVARESYRPLVKFLLNRRDIRLTLNISGSLTEQLINIPRHRDVVLGIRRLLERGQVELTDSAMYHAVLPFLPEQEILRQIDFNHAVNRKVFGHAYRPEGFFPPEMAYSPRLARVLDQRGYRWVILDGMSRGGIVDYTRRYRIQGTKLSAIFRNRYISDYLAFQTQRSDTGKFMETVERWNGQRDVLVTAMDGENLGHHRHVAKRIWQTLVRLPHIEPVTISEVLPSLRPVVTIAPRAASWSSRLIELKRQVPFALWKNPNNALHQLQWQLFTAVHKLITARERRGRLTLPLRREFDQSASSDWYWWASREPWWDGSIIITSTDRLRVIAEELNPPSSVLEKIRALSEKIIATVHRWELSGNARRHSKAFLSHERVPRYLGGKSVK